MLIGIVGKANVGKSTFFKAATLSEVEIANYPFATIKPNEGVGFVRHECVERFFKVKCNPQKGFCINGERFIPMKLVDVAGLVPGAHEGKGMGNQFLNDLSTADVLIHVVDMAGTTNEGGEPIKAGSYDPANDIKFLEQELDLWFYSMMKKNWGKFARQATLEHKDVDKALYAQFSGLKVTLEMIKNAKISKKLADWTDDDIKRFASKLRQKSKPIIIAANKIDLPTGESNLKRIRKEFPKHLIIPCSAESELALREAAKHELVEYIPGDGRFKILKPGKLSEKQKKALKFLESYLKKWKNTGVQQCLNSAVYDLLKYITIFPGGISKLADSKGNILPDAFLLPPGSTALDFANHIHTDLADNFIKAIDVKTKKVVGKDHKLKDGDVVEVVSRK